MSDDPTRPEPDLDAPPRSVRAMPGVGLVVVVLSGAQKGVTRHVVERLTIGSAPANDLVLDDDTVSRRHCEIFRTPAGMAIRDLGSTNGVFVDGARVQDAAVGAGTNLRVGKIDVSLRASPPRVDVAEGGPGSPAHGAHGAAAGHPASFPPGAGHDIFQFDPQKSYRETRARFDAEFERRYVKWLLARHGGNVSAAAREAKMDRKHLHDMAKKHGLRGSDADDA